MANRIRSLTLRPTAYRFYPTALSSCTKQTRSFFSTRNPINRTELSDRLNFLSITLLSSSWSDYLNLTLNLSLWESELQTLEEKAKEYANDESIQQQLNEVQNSMDCLIRTSDVRDDLTEVMEHSSRHAGIAGCGINKTDDVENLKEHAEMASKLYDQLLKEYPTLTPKVEESLGHALVLMRQKCRYQFSSQHQYFF